MVKKISYAYQDSPQYTRGYATSARLSNNGNGDVVLDFIEEYIDPVLVRYQDYERDEQAYTHSYDEVKLIHERKSTMVMSVEQAVNLARRILETYGPGGGEDEIS